jgi:hypothetical protein
MNFFVIILLWQNILYLCTLFLVQRGKWCPLVEAVKSVLKKLFKINEIQLVHLLIV